MDTQQLRGTLLATLNRGQSTEFLETEFIARISLSLRGEILVIALKLRERDGPLRVARQFELNRADCPDVPALLQLVIEEFSREIPAEQERASTATSPPPSQEVTHADSNYETRLGLSLLAQLSPSHVAYGANLAVTTPWRGNWHWLATVNVRGGLPAMSESKRYERFEILAGVGIETRPWQLLWQLEVRGGVTLVRGHELEKNLPAAAPTVEIATGLFWRSKNFLIGPRFGVGLLPHRVQILPENATHQISVLHMGLTIQYELN